MTADVDRLADRRTAARRPGLDQQPAAVLAAEPEQRRRAEQLGIGREALGDQLAQPPGGRLDPLLLGAPRHRPRSGARRAGSAAPRGGSSSSARKPAASCRAACRMLGAPVASAWTSTLPPASPRPLRPASWVISEKVRSSERKSGSRRVASASRTTPEGDLGEVVALGDHLGPDQDPGVGLVEAAAAGRRGPRRPRPRRSRAGRPAAARAAPPSSASIRWVPEPTLAIVTEEQSGQRLRRRLGVAAVMAAQAAPAVQDQRDVAVGALATPARRSGRRDGSTSRGG